MKKYTVREGSIAWWVVLLAKGLLFTTMMAGIPIVMYVFA